MYGKELIMTENGHRSREKKIISSNERPIKGKREKFSAGVLNTQNGNEVWLASSFIHFSGRKLNKNLSRNFWWVRSLADKQSSWQNIIMKTNITISAACA